MNPLSPEDAAHLQAAQEFLKQGLAVEAGAEFTKLTGACPDHPDVLETCWEIQAQRGQWDDALDTAAALQRAAPENHLAWMYRACSLDELGRPKEAFETLASAFEQFPNVPTIPYNLACCACKLGRLKDASAWIAKAIAIGGRAEIKLMALDDADLAPLLDEICAL